MITRGECLFLVVGFLTIVVMYIVVLRNIHTIDRNNKFSVKQKKQINQTYEDIFTSHRCRPEHFS